MAIYRVKSFSLAKFFKKSSKKAKNIYRNLTRDNVGEIKKLKQANLRAESGRTKAELESIKLKKALTETQEQLGSTRKELTGMTEKYNNSQKDLGKANKSKKAWRTAAVGATTLGVGSTVGAYELGKRNKNFSDSEKYHNAITRAGLAADIAGLGGLGYALHDNNRSKKKFLKESEETIKDVAKKSGGSISKGVGEMELSLPKNLSDKKKAEFIKESVDRLTKSANKYNKRLARNKKIGKIAGTIGLAGGGVALASELTKKKK